MSVSRRRFLGGLGAVTAAVALSACSSDTDGEAAPASTTGEATGSGAFPVTLVHKYGKTVVTSAPERVVCLGLTDQDPVLALGVVPVGVTYWLGDKKAQGIYPWAAGELGSAARPTLLQFDDGIQVEKVAALEPDLVIALYSSITEAEYTKLSALGVPVVAPSAGYVDSGMPWDLRTTITGKALGRETEAEQVVTRVKRDIAAAKDANPQIVGKTAVVAAGFEGLSVYGAQDARMHLLTELGFASHPLVAQAKEKFYADISPERTSELGDADVVVWIDRSANKQVDTLFRQTTAYREGRYVDLPSEDSGTYALALNFVSPLSIPYVLKRYVPQLTAAVDGNPATKVPQVSG